jgi:WD40 repeat protein
MVGSGDGTIAKIGFKDMKVKAEAQVLGSVTSFSLTADGTHFFAGTSKATIYWSDADTITPELRNTCHYERINDLAFPYEYSSVFATCSVNDIRVWNSSTRQELLRIEVPGLECYTISFMNDGKSIISGWNDGKIRAFLPQSGKLYYVINDAHNHGVSAITSTNDCTRIISGGDQGEVRVWEIGSQTQVMIASMKEHRARVSDIKVNQKDDQAVSASHDGSCIVWDLENFTRIICLFESTMFKQVVYHPDESQLLTAGSDRKITYWDCFDGQAIRMLDGSDSGEINALDITREGEH